MFIEEDDPNFNANLFKRYIYIFQKIYNKINF